MHPRMRYLVPILATLMVPAWGCVPNEREPARERWATTNDTNVQIDWDKINEAYKAANGPQDLERRVNEIYQGSEVISIAVADLDDKNQQVIGFFDRNTSGSVDEGEKIFTIRRRVTGEGTAEMQTQGHGPYGYYHSPLLTIASGMLLGSMMSRAMMPGYTPMYSRPYTTSPSRLGQISQSRPAFRTGTGAGYRTTSPGQYNRPRVSGSGRTYGGGPALRGGGRFGIQRNGRVQPVRLTA
jgi:hypothetical protein